MSERSHRPDIERALEEWGRNVAIPPTPDIAPKVRAALEASAGRRRRIWRWLAGPGRLLILAPAALLVIVALIVRANAVPSQPGRTVLAGPTAHKILHLAARRHVGPNRIVHLKYRVRMPGQEPKRLGVWERYHGGRVTAAEIYHGPNLHLAMTFVTRPGSVTRMWTSQPDLTDRLLVHLLRALPVQQNGLLAARVILGDVGSGSASVDVGDIRTIGRHRAYPVTVRYGARSKAVTLYYDARNYTLLRAEGAGYRQTLVEAYAMPAAETPVRVVKILREGRSPIFVGAGY